MGQIGDFKDNATKHIIAMDFDGVITERNMYPAGGKPRKYAREVINLLHALGVAVIIWTCRDHDDIDGLKWWLFMEGFSYTNINTSIQHAPFKYESRKIYAHMYVDDAGFGWEDDNEEIMIDVMAVFMLKIMKIDPIVVSQTANKIRRGEEIDIEQLKKHIH